MTRDEFRNQMESFKKARESNPQLSYWQWKTNSYDEGTDKNGINSSSDGIYIMSDSEQKKYNKKYNEKKQQEYDARQRILNHMYYSANPKASLLFGWGNKDKNYTGSYYLDEKIDIADQKGLKGFERTPNLERDLNKLYVFGDTTNFKEYNKPLIVNNDTLSNLYKSYYGKIIPDTLIFRKELKPTIDEYIANKDIISYDANQLNKNQFYFGNNDEIKSKISVDNVANASGVFKKQKDKYYLHAFDLFDFGKNFDKTYIPFVGSYLQNVLDPNEYFPNSGPFLLRQDIPIKFVDYYEYTDKPISGDYFLKDLLLKDSKNNKKLFENNEKLIQSQQNGTDEDGIQFQANSELTPDQQEALNQRMFQLHRMSGSISPVFDIQTASDFTPIGNITTAYDVYNSVVNGDYLTAGLIGAAALAPKPLVKAAKRVWHKIPEVNPKYFENKLTEFFDNQKKKKLTPNGLNAQIYQDAVNQRNQIIEDLYTNPQYWERAEAIKRAYGDDYAKVYKDVLDTYENNYLGLPEPRAKNIDAKAEMAAKENALKRYLQTGKAAPIYNFDYNINPYLDLIDNPTTRHELSHYVDFNLAQNSNPDFNNDMLKELKKDLSKDNNLLMPKDTDYFRKGTEQKSYMNTLRQFMFDRGLINSLGEKVTTKKIKEAIKLLPVQMNAVKAAYLQFKSPGQYTKWFNKIPLLGTTAPVLYLTTEQEENKSN